MITDNPSLKARFMQSLALILVMTGLYLGLSRKLIDLWDLWMSDSLRSVGIIMPLAALYFFFKAAPDMDWTRGRWWGLALMIFPMAWVAGVGEHAAVVGFLAGHPTGISMAPTGILMAIYFSGAIIFWGGTSAWHALKFPLFLLFFVNPVPSLFSTFDVQLQTIAALTARGFAHLIALPVEPGLLKMMFSPSLGMFIAPECDGLRGMAAMLCLSLIWGHVHRMTWMAHGFYVLLCVALAYLMNLVRLCFVVIYYWFAVRMDSIASIGEEIDYVIGGVIFFILALFVFAYPEKLKQP